jgi:hypothetical protein
MRKLIMVIRLNNPGGSTRSPKYLRVSEGDGGSLGYRMSDTSGRGYSLSSLQIKEPFPVWPAGSNATLLLKIQAVLRNGVYSFHSVEMAPEAPTDHWADDDEFPVSDWRYEVANDDTRLGYRDWVGECRNG